ncbi:hypothetical protein JMJ77_0005682, partial [Colletotrichum scovillei]
LFFPLHSSFSAVVSISSHGSLLLAHWGQQGLQGTVWTSNGLVPRCFCNRSLSSSLES